MRATTQYYINVIQLCEESSNSLLGLDNVIDVTLIYALVINIGKSFREASKKNKIR